ncbi:MAG: CpXC domain-containing protein, partial [Chloroflexi bacterium]|nr:CpXC domain-containing protein [Chloroflexota bacterium]
MTCPNCRNQFQAPVEQILDVKADPGAKMRVLNGLVNMAVCPHCKMGGPLGLPFLYHDPDKELAFIYMPMEAGRDDLERQQAIGKLTSTVMNDLPPEERKAYLLQPEIFLTLENLANKILEADGVTPEMIEAQKAKA